MTTPKVIGNPDKDLGVSVEIELTREGKAVFTGASEIERLDLDRTAGNWLGTKGLPVVDRHVAPGNMVGTQRFLSYSLPPKQAEVMSPDDLMAEFASGSNRGTANAAKIVAGRINKELASGRER